MKKAEKEQALNLRKRGFTLREIAKYTNVSVSTISLWLKGEAWSQKITDDNQKRASKENSKRISLLNKARGNQYKKLYAEAERSAVTEYKHYRTNPLFIAGLMLYVVNGDNSDTSVIRITSTHMEIHKVFIKFITEFLGVPREKLRFWLLLYPDLDEERCFRAWSKKIAIPMTKFHKSQVIQGISKNPTLHYGVGNTIIGSTVIKRKLTKWVELTLKEL